MSLEPPYRHVDVPGDGPEAQYGVGVGAGNIGGGAAPEFVVLSSNTLHVYVDSLPTVDRTYVSPGTADPCPDRFLRRCCPRPPASTAP